MFPFCVLVPEKKELRNERQVPTFEGQGKTRAVPMLRAWRLCFLRERTVRHGRQGRAGAARQGMVDQGRVATQYHPNKPGLEIVVSSP